MSKKRLGEISLETGGGGYDDIQKEPMRRERTSERESGHRKDKERKS